MRELPITIIKGKPAVGSKHALVVQESADIICVVIDMDSKYCQIEGAGYHGFPEVFVAPSERTIHPEPPDKAVSHVTTIQFPTLPGWSVFCADCYRHTVSITLVRGDGGALNG